MKEKFIMDLKYILNWMYKAYYNINIMLTVLNFRNLESPSSLMYLITVSPFHPQSFGCSQPCEEIIINCCLPQPIYIFSLDK